MSLDLQPLFDDLLRQLHDFEACLHCEKQLLEEHSLEDYPALLRKKEAIVMSIRQHQEALLADKPSDMSAKDFIHRMIAQQRPDAQQPLNSTWQSIAQRLSVCEAHSQANAMVIQASRNITNYFIDLITARDKNRTYSKNAKTTSHIASTHSKRV